MNRPCVCVHPNTPTLQAQSHRQCNHMPRCIRTRRIELSPMKRRTPWPGFVPTAVSLGLYAVLASMAAHATPAATSPALSPIPSADEIVHTVQKGDTLQGLARFYLTEPRQWPLLQARNKVANPRHLQPGSVLRIPAHLLPTESATVQFVHGTVTTQAHAGSTPAPVARGEKLQEGAALRVADDAFVTVQLADGTLVRVQAQSEVQLRQLRRRGRTGSVQSVLEMRSGALDATVPPSSEPLRRMQIRTPQAVTSVRGTHFDVTMTQAGQTMAAVLQGTVAVQARPDETTAGAAPQSVPATLLPSGQGLVVAADGTVGVPRALLAAPDLSGVPATFGETGLLSLTLPALPGAVGYLAQVAKDADFAQVVRHGRFANGQLRWKAVDDGRYYLVVRAIDSAGIAGIPATQSLTVKTRPIAPLHQQPAPAGVLAKGAGELRCTPVQGVLWYRIQIATDAAFTTPLRDEQRLTECRLTVHDLPTGPYFWRVSSQLQMPDGSIDQGPFTQPQPYAVAERLAMVSLPSMQDQDGDTSVRLHWSGQPGQRFRLQLAPAKDPAFERMAQDTVLDAPEWTAPQLPAGTYLVRIQILDASGLTSDFSPPREIQVHGGLRSGSGLPILTSSGEPVVRP